MNTRFIFSVIAASLAAPAMAQHGTAGVYNAPSGYGDGTYVKENAPGRRPIPTTYLREADVAWEKRVWREIDMREKQNLPLYYPLENIQDRSSLFQTLTGHILKGDILAFADEEFLRPYELADIRKKLVMCDSVPMIMYEEDGTPVEQKVWACDSTSIYRHVLKFRLKEDWFFDKQKSTLEVRIIGLAAYEYVEDKEAYRELFWVYFPACRPYFANSEIFNVKNDAERRSLDDVFWKRQFSSTVVKESNVYDRFIGEYEKGIGALLESDKVKTDIFKWEHDLWHF